MLCCCGVVAAVCAGVRVVVVGGSAAARRSSSAARAARRRSRVVVGARVAVGVVRPLMLTLPPLLAALPPVPADTVLVFVVVLYESLLLTVPPLLAALPLAPAVVLAVVVLVRCCTTVGGLLPPLVAELPSLLVVVVLVLPDPVIVLLPPLLAVGLKAPDVVAVGRLGGAVVRPLDRVFATIIGVRAIRAGGGRCCRRRLRAGVVRPLTVFSPPLLAELTCRLPVVDAVLRAYWRSGCCPLAWIAVLVPPFVDPALMPLPAAEPPPAVGYWTGGVATDIDRLAAISGRCARCRCWSPSGCWSW